jgi:hypothetical protein
MSEALVVSQVVLWIAVVARRRRRGVRPAAWRVLYERRARGCAADWPRPARRRDLLRSCTRTLPMARAPSAVRATTGAVRSSLPAHVPVCKELPSAVRPSRNASTAGLTSSWQRRPAREHEPFVRREGLRRPVPARAARAHAQ